MKASPLARHYEALTPWERLPLILAAAARGDEPERSRLVRSAPRLAYAVQDHFGLTQAFFGVATGHLLRVLDLVACYFAILAAPSSGEEAGAEGVPEAALLYGYLIRVNLAGWRQFCEEHQLNSEVFWSRLPGFDTLQVVEGFVGAASFDIEGVRRCAPHFGCNPQAVPTTEDIAAALRKGLQTAVEMWT